MKLLFDSDFLVALYKPDDSNHLKSTNIYRKIETESTLIALNIVFQEATTVISKRMNMYHARKFHDSIHKLINNIVYLDLVLEDKSWRIFLKETKKGVSFVDCANLAVCDFYKIDGILSFDEFYKDKLVTT